MSPAFEAYQLIPASTQRTASVIFLHGLGQSNLTWRLMITEALAPRLPHIEWILPQAPNHPVSMNQGQPRPSWFDVARLPPGHNEYDEAGIAESISLVESIILTLVHSGLDSRRIILAGFSQGAALSMLVALDTLYDLGGIVSLSGWIPRRARNQVAHTAPNLPILWCHGTADTEIPLTYAEEAIDFLRSRSSDPRKLKLITYDRLGHNINDRELEDLIVWLAQVSR
ncbi:Phospholipase/carboxylesterase/thioesterase [Infundibulicybe gibba]|nr:Phospholipase/carboxylesterase/thioesterase [Infundibulicybe gibba]